MMTPDEELAAAGRVTADGQTLFVASRLSNDSRSSTRRSRQRGVAIERASHPKAPRAELRRNTSSFPQQRPFSWLACSLF